MSGTDRAAGRFEQVIDPDVGLDDSSPRSDSRPWRWDVLLVTAIGGILGAEARYGLDNALPHAGREFPWSTVVVNASGCLLIGALMVLLLELTYPHRLARPFLGVGVLGGYTTYSTFAVDVQRLLLDHRPLVALSYVVVTVLGCAVAVWLSSTLTLTVGRAVLTRRARSGR
jgi:CrcB protein